MAGRKTSGTMRKPVKVKIPAPEEPSKSANTRARRLARKRKAEIMAGR